MAIFNLKKREIECKVVYYGPGRCGKTTNLEYIYGSYKKQVKGEMVSINTEGDRTLFFDFLPIGLGQIRGCNVRVQLYTVPGQVKYSSTRKLVLRGVDGIIFVADSLEVRREKNMLSLKDLQSKGFTGSRSALYRHIEKDLKPQREAQNIKTYQPYETFLHEYLRLQLLAAKLSFDPVDLTDLSQSRSHRFEAPRLPKLDRHTF